MHSIMSQTSLSLQPKASMFEFMCEVRCHGFCGGVIDGLPQVQ